MGFWKNVAYDMSRGMLKQKAIEYNYELRYSNLSDKDRKKLIAKEEANLKIDKML